MKIIFFNNKFSQINNNNLKIINKIEEIKNNINKKEYKMIKDNALKLYQLLFKTSLKDMYIQYINLDNKNKLFYNFDSIKVKFDKI